MGERWIVVGGGFRGHVGAYLLASRKDDVVLVDAGRSGGLSSPEPWHGLYLDRGCHLIDNADDRTTAILLDFLGDNVAPVNVRYASVTNGVTTEGVAIPDLGAYGDAAARRILDELTKAVAQPPYDARTLQDVLDARFGPTAGRYLAGVTRKMYCAEPAALDAAAFALSPFHRIKFLPDAEADVLKRDLAFDDRVASSSAADPMRFYRARAGAYPHRNFYPKRDGLHGLRESAIARLRALGVTIRTGEAVARVETDMHAATVVLANGDTVRGDRVLWTLDAGALAQALAGENTLAGHVHAVPMVLHYFLIAASDAGPLTYLQNFDARDDVFRVSVPGSYVSPPPGALSYVCCEVPGQHDDAAQAWSQVRRHGMARCERPLDTLTVTMPRSYWMPRVGYGDASHALTAHVKNLPRLTHTDDLVFARSDVVASLMRALDA
jgi:protoporphyrinogen oxidase